MGLSNATPTAWKKRGLTPKADTLAVIASYFGVSTDCLLGKEEKENSPSEMQLTEGERRLIELLRKFPEDRTEFAVSMVFSALENMPVEEKNDK
jgi:transcriptional regulator with XRE-family HTH domain